MFICTLALLSELHTWCRLLLVSISTTPWT
jgi:hypothetical protein